MGDLNALRLLHRIRVHSKAMILGGDLAAARKQVLHRVIHTPVSMMHFESGNTMGQWKGTIENRICFGRYHE